MIATYRHAFLALASVPLVLFACGSDDSVPAATVTSSSAGGSTATSTSSTSSTGGSDGGMGGAPSAHGCLTAADFGYSGSLKQLFDAIGMPGERDYYAFDGQEGQWVAIAAQAKPSSGVKLDTVMRLYDSEGTELVATDDDVYGFETSQYSEIIIRIPETRRYCIEILDYEDYLGTPSVGGPGEEYLVAMMPVTTYYSPVTIEAEPNDDLGSAQSVTLHASLSAGAIVGALDAEETDVFTIPPTSETQDNLWIYFTPEGPGGDQTDGWGSTGGLGRLSVIAEDGTTLLASLAYEDSMDACIWGDCVLSVPVEAGKSYYAVLERDGRPLGDNDFYTVLVRNDSAIGLTEPAGDESDDVNDTSLGAVDVGAGLPLSTGGTAYFFHGWLPEGDEDWWHLPSSEANEAVTVHCGAFNYGSGIDDFTVETWMDANLGQAPDRSESETPGQFVAWAGSLEIKSSDEPLAGGTGYHFRISATSFSSEITSRWYFCDVRTLPQVN